MKSILVTGLCTLHWGRLQYGNIGNYYIVEPLFRELHRHFPEYNILTSFQMDAKFVESENIEVLPMELYYAWKEETDLLNAETDVSVAEQYVRGEECKLSPYVEALLKCEYVINVSGDMWGDNAEHVGHNRFLVDCLKMKAAQILKRKTVLYAVTPGPFSKKEENTLAREVFEGFSLVVIREKISKTNLAKWNFPVENVVWAPCPSFLFEPNYEYESEWTKAIDLSHQNGHKVAGVTFGGFNMPYGPYDMWPREPEQYDVFLKLAKYMIEDLGLDIIIFSHTNGFDLPPKFKLINGRDYMILEQFCHLLIENNPEYKEHVTLINEPLLPKDIKRVIGKLDMLLTGRVHASVAAASQCIPTVYMEYDRNVIYSDKMLGFSSMLEMQELVCTPGDLEVLKSKVQNCYLKQQEIKAKLQKVVPQIQREADAIYEKIKEL